MKLIKLKNVSIPDVPDNQEPYATRPIPKQGIPLHHLCACIGGTGSGKTTSLLKFLMWYDKAGTFDRLIIFSPTLSREPKGKAFLEADHNFEISYYHEYSDAIMMEERERMLGDIQEWNRFLKKKEAWEKFKRCKSVEDLTMDELVLLEECDFEKPKWIYDREYYPTCALLLDDHVGKRGVFNANCRSKLVEVCVEHRHLSLSIYLLSQVFANFVPKQLRGGVINLWILFSTKSQHHKEEIAEQVANKVDENTFIALWDYATSRSQHDALVVDYKAPETKFMFRRNFDTLIQFNEHEITSQPITNEQ